MRVMEQIVRICQMDEHVPMFIIGKSMEPLFLTGDLIFVKKKKEYSLNDIVLFQYGDCKEKIAHRIISIEKDLYICKGDNSPSLEYIEKGKILGYVAYGMRGQVVIFCAH